LKSLFVLSLPRSLSTVIYHAARLSLDLREPVWTTDGEILNGDRIVLSDAHDTHDVAKYVDPRRDPPLFVRMTALLDDAVQPEGYAYKDVVNPFVIAQWLQGRDLAVLKVRRDIADVALSMRTRGWLYPCRVASAAADSDEALIHGLVLAWRAIDGVEGETIDYAKLVENDSLLQETLRRLYPGERVLRARFIDDAFAADRDKILRRRESDEHHRMACILESLM
jgi:hypothetical protein